MLAVARRVERAARADCPVLISGVRGTGKKLVAEAIHRRSRRGLGPLVVIDTERAEGRLPEDELFGTADRPGRLTAAEGGTLLVAEITGLSGTAQAKLLEAVEDRHLAHPTYSDDRKIDFRLMATTRYELSESVKHGTVRKDLHYRLGVVTIHVPPLRERREDIPLLVPHLLTELSRASGKPAPSVEPELMRYLVEHPWPGNGRQLRDCLETMMSEVNAKVLQMNHLPFRFVDRAGDFSDSPREGQIDTLAQLERAAVMRALRTHQGNRTQAANALGISVRTLQRKLKQWDE
jgi:DNA-binding NtrC family response regulator